MDRFVASFSPQGLEAVINLTELSHEDAESIMTQSDPLLRTNRFLGTMNGLQIRAIFQHGLEVWLFNSDLCANDIEMAFRENPQRMADTVRSLGQLFARNSEASLGKKNRNAIS